ncbi:unnamed protein product, partial [Vitis vinifera]
SSWEAGGIKEKGNKDSSTSVHSCKRTKLCLLKINGESWVCSLSCRGWLLLALVIIGASEV